MRELQLHQTSLSHGPENVKKLVFAIINQAYSDVKAYHKILVHPPKKLDPDRLAAKRLLLYRDYTTSMSFFFTNLPDNDNRPQMYRYLDWIGMDGDYKIKAILRNVRKLESLIEVASAN